jgi:hypothetical protein
MTSFTSLLLAAALAVPVPADAKDDAPSPEPTGPAPRMAFLKGDADGKIIVTVRRTAVINNANGAVINTLRLEKVELKDVQGLTIATADGKKVELADVTKRLVSGAYVVMPADGKAIATGYLRMLRPDVLVLTSPEMLNVATTASVVGGIRVGPGVQIQPLPAQILPVPAPPPAPAPPGRK